MQLVEPVSLGDERRAARVAAHAARERREQPERAREQRRLPAAARPVDDDEVAARHREVDPGQGHGARATEVRGAELQERAHGAA
ncbi:MAG: hypothetical protein R3F49_17600 [Planctomycetota bacterium]